MHLPKLKTLHLYQNHVCCSSGLRRLIKQMSELPYTIAKMTALEQLCLSQNVISRLPASLGSMTQLEVLELHVRSLRFERVMAHRQQFNQLTTLPATFIKLTNLVVLKVLLGCGAADSRSRFTATHSTL